jgi:hypothetical protein
VGEDGSGNTIPCNQTTLTAGNNGHFGVTPGEREERERGDRRGKIEGRGRREIKGGEER